MTNILHNYSDFAVCTIDSFVHKIIKTFAHDLYIPVNFEVEMDEDVLLNEAINLLISNAGIDEELTKILVEFTETKTDDERSWHIENDIKDFARSLLKEEGQIYLEKLQILRLEDFNNIISKASKIIKEFEENIKSAATEADKIIKNNNINTETFYQGNRGISKYFENLANEAFDKIKPNSYVTKTIEEGKWTSGKANAGDISSINAISGKLSAIYKSLSDTIENKYSQYLLIRMLLQNIYPIAVLNEIKKVIETIKKENNILHISEFNTIISGIVMKEPVPFIYERTGEKV